MTERVEPEGCPVCGHTVKILYQIIADYQNRESKDHIGELVKTIQDLRQKIINLETKKSEGEK